MNVRQHFATTYRPLIKKTTSFVYRSTCLVHFTMLAPIYEWMLLLCRHIVTCIFIVAIVCALVHFTKNNLYIGGFLEYAVKARDSRF